MILEERIKRTDTQNEKGRLLSIWQIVIFNISEDGKSVTESITLSKAGKKERSVVLQ